MRQAFPKKIIVLISLFILLVVLGIIFIFMKPKDVPQEELSEIKVTEEKTGSEYLSLGKSVEGRSIDSYTFGKGKNHLLFVGGIHGGYEWNSVLLAYKFVDYFTANPKLIPENLSLTIIPSANPDGVFKVVGKEGRFTAEEAQVKDTTTGLGRFNTNNVDLNRNFDCNWQAESTWRNEVVSAGTIAFSEPEAKALRDFVKNNTISAAVFFHSQAGAVYASECNGGVLLRTLDIMNAYSTASGYKAVKTFDSYKITGDAEGWLASIGIPAVTVELQTHETIEWERNLAGVKALFDYYGSK